MNNHILTVVAGVWEAAGAIGYWLLRPKGGYIIIDPRGKVDGIIQSDTEGVK